MCARLYLQLHHVAARRRANQAGADRRVGFVEGADVARVVVVVHDLRRQANAVAPHIPEGHTCPEQLCAVHAAQGRTFLWYSRWQAAGSELRSASAGSEVLASAPAALLYACIIVTKLFSQRPGNTRFADQKTESEVFRVGSRAEKYMKKKAARD